MYNILTFRLLDDPTFSIVAMVVNMGTATAETTIVFESLSLHLSCLFVMCYLRYNLIFGQ